MLISRISGRAMKNAIVDLRCTSLCRPERRSRLRTAALRAAISAMKGSVRVCRGFNAAGTPSWPDGVPSASCLIAHIALELVRRPIQGLLQWLALEVSDGHLGHGALVVDLLGDLVRRRGSRDRERLRMIGIGIAEQ